MNTLEDSHMNIIYEICSSGNIKILNEFIEVVETAEEKLKGLAFPLQVACSNGHLDIVNRLIELGVDVNAKSNDGETALHLAQRNGTLDIVNRLMELDSCL